MQWRRGEVAGRIGKIGGDPNLHRRGGPQPNAGTGRGWLVSMSENFEDIFYGYKDLVWSLINASGIPHPDSGDVFQEAWRSIHSSLKGYRGEASLQAWIGTIARRRCADYWEQKKRHDSRFNPAPEWDPEGAPFVEWRTALDELSSREAAAALRRGLEGLERDQRFVLEKRIEGLKYREIAELYNELNLAKVDTNWVGKRIFEARERLAEILRGEGLP